MKFQLKLFFKLTTFSLCIFLYTSPKSNAQSDCFTLDFESISGAVLSDNLEVSDQYLNSNGVLFELEDGTFPHIAKYGFPFTAFNSFIGEFMMESELVGAYFLTDDGLLEGLIATPLIMTFSSPVDSVSGMVLDVDFDEVFTIEARDLLDSVISTVVVAAGDEGTGDAIATSWGLHAGDQLFYSLKISGEREVAGAFGFAFDNFVTCPIDASNIGQGGTTATEDPLFNSVKVYPNPAPGSFVVEVLNNEKVNFIGLYDLMGRKLGFQSLLENDSIQIESEFQGVVLLKIQIGEKVLTQKILLH